MAELMGFFFQIGFLLFLLALGYGVGHVRERRHLQQIAARLTNLRDVGVSNRRRIPNPDAARTLGLVTGCTVVATDYFKVFAAALRNLFGGEIRSFTTLVARARNEALVRMLTEAQALGANAVINVRFETSTIGGQQQKKAGGVEVLAYGTAVRLSSGSGA